jgi:hypothetical protein
MKTTLGAILIFVGLIAVAGSANDCDGACMEQANTIGEMLMVIAGGVVAMVLGGLLIANAESN